MENKLDYQAQLFTNRLQKKYKELRKWARKNRVSCYRLYDRDIPEIPVSLDLYEFLPGFVSNPLEAARFLGEQNAKLSANDLSCEKDIKSRTFAVLYLYERPYEKSEEEEELWLSKMANAASKVLGIDISQIIKKERKHQKGSNQYEKIEEEFQIQGLIQEQGQIFNINLSNYLDTGLFFDHRPLRAIVRDECSNKSVLNLFCYTGSFSVYSAAGNAKTVESVDLSNTYINWAKENMKQNCFTDRKKYIFTKADCIEYLKEKAKSTKVEDKYDIIILDPPTFSNSKSTQNVLDINKDWPQLVLNSLKCLSNGGTLYFSTNSERLKFDRSLLPQALDNKAVISVTDMTQVSIPKDYEGTKCHRLWKFQLGKI